MEILATADKGAYIAFAAIPLDLYKRGLNDGLNHWTVSLGFFGGGGGVCFDEFVHKDRILILENS